MTVLVSLTPEHVQAVKEARAKLVCLAALGVQVEVLVDQLGDILDLARAEELHSVDYRRTETLRKVAEDGARLMAHDGPYPPSFPKNEKYHNLMCDVFDCRDGK